jgi:calcium-translocating P-type ATPase
VAIAAVPEGLPLLAGVAEAAVAQRLAGRNALVRRLSAVEALGRVDVVCSDKTGTLTCGRLAVTVVDDLRVEAEVSTNMLPSACQVLLAAAFASPEPDHPDALAHATDAAVLHAAAQAGLTDALSAPRRSEAPFDPVRSLHATELSDRLCVKGATEVLAPRCTQVRAADGSREPLDSDGRASLEARAETLAGRGLRVLMVAEGPSASDVEDPQGLTALGFVGISDPVRAGARDAVARCQAAGIRVIMLTGDHQATARAIAAQAGIPLHNGAMMTGEELGELDDVALARRLEDVSVIARITPIDKVRIVESLQRAGGTVAMTGDGVNDAPALRLADVGVAMGAGGTEVARQAADLVLADDEFGTLTDALLEGRSLWHNLHEALGLLLGGNLGEMGLMAGVALLGRGAVLGTRQILVVNLLTDVLPAVAVAVQPPREPELALIERRGDDAFDSQLLGAVLRRGAATAAPALVAVLAAQALGAPAATVGYSSVILTQLAQTLQMGRVQDRLNRSVAGAIAGSVALLGITVGVAPVRNFLGLAAPTQTALALVAGTAPAAMATARALDT